MSTTYILIDGSYYIFYRLFALINWWKLSHKDDPCENLHENNEFVERFKDMFQTKLREIPKKINIPKSSNVKFIVGLDCRRHNIWRLNLYSQYKGTRGDYSDAKNPPGPFFKMVYEEKLFNKIQDIDIETLYNENLEGDDCLAICSKYLIEQNPDNLVYIITSDTDYMQLVKSNVYLYNLKYKPVNTEKNSLGNPEKDLLYKIIIGDKSDNIPPVFPKCGPKKTLEYINNIEKFEEDLLKLNGYEQYKLNRRLIDFTQIPLLLQQDIINQCKEKISK
jgi:5'-3' exonuclease